MDTKTVIRLIKSLKVIFKVRIALCKITLFTANYITLLYTSFELCPKVGDGLIRRRFELA